MAETDLIIDEIDFEVKGKAKTLPFHFFDEIDSTNNYLKRIAAEHPSETIVACANFQTGGRGQFERTWESAADKNLLFSLLLHPKMKVNEAPLLTQVTAEVARDILKGLTGEDDFSIKKPNDVLFAGKKICGILTEQESQGSEIKFVIIGVGININSLQDELPDGAISLMDILGKEHDPQEVLGLFLSHFFERVSV